MKKRILAVMMGLAALAGVAGVSTTASAEDATIGSMTLDQLKSALGMSAYVQAGYTYNIKNPPSMTNELRAFDGAHDSATIDLVQLIFAKEPAAGSGGYKLKISAGETAKFIHSAGLDQSDGFDLTEGYVSYVAPVGSGLRFDMGKMGTFIGAEVMEAKDNPNYSRSFLYTYAEPLTHTGLKMSYALSDALGISLFAVNGWDNSTDNNSAKSYGAGIALTTGRVAEYFNVLTGPEQTANNQDKRVLYDYVGAVTITDSLSLILNGDYGREQNAAAPGAAEWGGAAAIVKYAFTDAVSAAVRGEYFSDRNGYRTGTKQRLNEYTASMDFTVSGGMVLRPEYRYDKSDQFAFYNNTKKKQHTVALAAMYAW